MKSSLFIFICFIFLQTFLIAEITPFTYFQPPSGWLISNPMHLKDGIKIGFVQSERKIFTPAISLSIEKIPCEEKTYIDAVKKNYHSDITQSVRELGFIKTKSGNATLLQIDAKNTWGKICILQAILVKDGHAIIQTATCLKEDFLKLNQHLLNSFRSLSVSSDFFSTVENKEDFEKWVHNLTTSWKKYLATAKGSKEDLFKESFFQKNQWIPFTEYITKDYEKLGLCWQILAIQYIKDLLMNL